MVEQSNNKAARATRRRRGMLIGVLAIIIGSVGLPFTGTLLTDTSFAQEASQQANPRADTWREARKGIEGTTTVRGQETDILIQSGGQVWREVREGPVTTYGGWILAGVILAIVLFQIVFGTVKLERRSGVKITRWSVFERVMHWYTAILFIILTITGLSLLLGKNIVMPLIGKEAFAAWANLAKPVHDYLSLPFAVGLALMILPWIGDNIPKAHDLKWLKMGGGYLGGHGEHPPAGFVNAGEKLWYWVLFLGSIALIWSGFYLLFPNMGWERSTMQLANVAHGISSVLLVAFAFGHVYLGTLGNQGSFEGMWTGEVDEEWAKMHHNLWYEEVKGKGQESGAGSHTAHA
jgi:formate dehydrogenase subunit gamma